MPEQMPRMRCARIFEQVSRKATESPSPWLSNLAVNRTDLARSLCLVARKPFIFDAGGGGRTRTELSLQRILSPLRMPFRHPGVLASMIVKS